MGIDERVNLMLERSATVVTSKKALLEALQSPLKKD
jgi:hypothetical protein